MLVVENSSKEKKASQEYQALRVEKADSKYRALWNELMEIGG